MERPSEESADSLNMNRRTALRVPGAIASLMNDGPITGAQPEIETAEQIVGSKFPVYRTPYVRKWLTTVLGRVPRGEDKEVVLSEIKQKRAEIAKDDVYVDIVYSNAYEILSRAGFSFDRLYAEWATTCGVTNPEEVKKFGTHLRIYDDFDLKDISSNENSRVTATALDAFCETLSMDDELETFLADRYKSKDCIAHGSFYLADADDEVIDDMVRLISDKSSLLHRAFMKGFAWEIDFFLDHYVLDEGIDSEFKKVRERDAHEARQIILSILQSTGNRLMSQLQALSRSTEVNSSNNPSPDDKCLPGDQARGDGAE